MNALIQFELLVCCPKPPRLGNKPCYMLCLTGASNVLFHVFHETVPSFNAVVKSITPTPDLATPNSQAS